MFTVALELPKEDIEEQIYTPIAEALPLRVLQLIRNVRLIPAGCKDILYISSIDFVVMAWFR